MPSSTTSLTVSCAVVAAAAGACSTTTIVEVQVGGNADAGAVVANDAAGASDATVLADAAEEPPTPDATALDATLADATVPVDAGKMADGSPTDASTIAQPIDAGSVNHWADWPIPNPPLTMLPHPQVYDTSLPGVVRDTVTGLVWQLSIDGATRDWNDAVAYCANLTDNDGGWRLPSRMELVSIADTTTIPAINTLAFGTLPATDSGAERFWSASQKADDSTMAWTVDFGTSVDLVLPESMTAPLLARCVRGL